MDPSAISVDAQRRWLVANILEGSTGVARHRILDGEEILNCGAAATIPSGASFNSFQTVDTVLWTAKRGRGEGGLNK
jgi:hypothetical protein